MATPPRSVMEESDFGRVEAAFIANGKAYGYTEQSLENLLRAGSRNRPREHRESLRRSEDRDSREIREKIAALEGRVANAQPLAQEDDAERISESGGRRAEIQMP